MITSAEIRNKFLKFFEDKGHKIIPSASLVPENDPSVLFNTAGMQPLAPYLLGQKHPMGNRLCDCQKCVRTNDIDEVGDNRHLTFFEMLGNWSLGDYFKKESIAWSFEFLTDKEVGLGLDKEKIYITVFEGNDNAPRDEEAYKIWKEYLPEDHIYFLPEENNWWSAGESGPCGPDTEIFYNITGKELNIKIKDDFIKADNNGEVIEIWNNVFMEYEKKDGKVAGKLSQKNVDTGMGLERVTMVCQNAETVFDTDLFCGEKTREDRIVIDHVKASLFMIADGVLPSNTGRGYVLRRLIRRALRFSDKPLKYFIDEVKNIYKDVYKLDGRRIIEEEENKFKQTLEKGLKEFEKNIHHISMASWKKSETQPDLEKLNKYPLISDDIVFKLITSFGFPKEIIIEMAKEKSVYIDWDKVDILLNKHQKLSKTASAGMFRGGLANHSEKTTKLHTAHHLLLAALQNIVDKNIKQRGSNITEDRLRMDFLCDHKLTDEEKRKVEEWVNDKIKRGLKIIRKELPLVEAEKLGAEMEFGSKYPEIVSIYFIEDENGNFISKEFCGGPHVLNTKELGHFKIQKEEAISAGIRRIKAVLE